MLRFEGISEDEVLATRAGSGTDPMIPSYEGGKFPLSTFLAARVREILADPFEWDRLPPQMTEWLLHQRRRSILPGPRDLLVETFPRANRYYMTCFPFEGRLAHQTLGMLLTRRLERAKLKPLGFVENDYGIAVYASGDIAGRAGREPGFLDELFSEDMRGDDLEDWLAESSLMKRPFRQCSVIAGLIERRFPGEKKTGRQVTISTDLVYDVLRKHEPDHVLLRATRQEAAGGLTDIARIGLVLARARGRIGRIVASVNPLIPKPGTTYQWMPMTDTAEIERKMKRLRPLVSGIDNVYFTIKSERHSYYQALLSLGDRRVAPAIEAAEKNGGQWRRAVAETGVDGDFYIFRDRSADAMLPWDIIDGGMTQQVVNVPA